MGNTLYEYSPIVTRSKLTWPHDARIAFYVGLNIEHYLVDRPPRPASSVARPRSFPIPSTSDGVTTAYASVFGA
jgi:hypothetical protein